MRARAKYKTIAVPDAKGDTLRHSLAAAAADAFGFMGVFTNDKGNRSRAHSITTAFWLSAVKQGTTFTACVKTQNCGRWPAHHPKRITMNHEKLCPVHRGTIEMSGRIAHIRHKSCRAPELQVRIFGPGVAYYIRHIFAHPYRLNCLRIASKNSANNDDVSNVSTIATTRPRG
jgi:hypothetical protein